MDEFIEHVFNNSQSSTTTQNAYHGLRRTFCLFAMSCDLLLIFILIKCKKIQTRTYFFILHFAITDALYVLTNPSLMVPIFASPLNTESADLFYCIADELDDLYQLGSFIFIGMLISNAAIKTRISTMTLILSVYAGLFLVFLSNIGLCVQSSVNFYAFPIYLISFIIILCITVALLGKEVNRFFKRRRNHPMNEKTTFRFNLARIYVYNSTVCDILVVLSFPYSIVFLFLSLSAYLSSLYITVYLAYNDRRIKLYILNLLKCRWREYDIDAAISFADDCSEDEGDDANINVQVNGDAVEIGRESAGNV